MAGLARSRGEACTRARYRGGFPWCRWRRGSWSWSWPRASCASLHAEARVTRACFQEIPAAAGKRTRAPAGVAERPRAAGARAAQVVRAARVSWARMRATMPVEEPQARVASRTPALTRRAAAAARPKPAWASVARSCARSWRKTIAASRATASPTARTRPSPMVANARVALATRSTFIAMVPKTVRPVRSVAATPASSAAATTWSSVARRASNR